MVQDALVVQVPRPAMIPAHHRLDPELRIALGSVDVPLPYNIRHHDVPARQEDQGRVMPAPMVAGLGGLHEAP